MYTTTNADRAEAWQDYRRTNLLDRIPYDRRTVDQLIVTWDRFNPAFKALQQFLKPGEAQARIRGNAEFVGLGADDVPTAALRQWLEEMLDVLASGAIASNENGIADMTPEERQTWHREQARLQVEQRRRERAALGDDDL